MRKNISFIGSGNVAYHLALTLYEKGYIIKQVFNRTESHALDICNTTKAKYVRKIKDFVFDENDLNIISLSDDAIDEVLGKVKFHNSILIHTAGSLDINVLNKYSTNYGVLYPLQSISRHQNIKFKDVPILIEANNISTLERIKHLSKSLSPHVVYCNSEQREMIHISAIFVSNFTNYLYTVGNDLMQNTGGDFELLLPLIKETTGRLKNNNPKLLQTGPAKRKDIKIISQHLEKLNNFPKYKNLYNFIL